MTGGFGEQTCRSCHFDNPANAPGGSLRLDGVPARYVRGREYRLTVVLRRPAITRGGFEMSARFASAPQPGGQAGVFRPVDARTRIVYAANSQVQYIQHTAAGSILDAGQGRWTVIWRAPDAATGEVVFNVAANASNDDASPLGDFIYTIENKSGGD